MLQGVYGHLREKFERALRNRTGARVSHEELVALLKSPAWMLLAQKEREELLADHGESGDIISSYPAIVERNGGRYLAYFPDLQDCTASGATVNDALLHAKEALSAAMQSHQDAGKPPPAPSSLEMIRPDGSGAAIALVSVELKA